MTTRPIIASAPMQGLTERAWRDAHRSVCGCIDNYCAPFARVEKGDVRHRDLREIAGEQVVPQILFKDADEFRVLARALTEAGFSRIDLNMGCPFPPQVNKGRGAGMMKRPATISEVAAVARDEFPGTQFSVKIRPGVDSPGEWKDALPHILSLKPVHITVHPRLARQRYSGNLDIEVFREIYLESGVPVIYNGDISAPGDIDSLLSAYPDLAGVMIGRGLLSRPTIAMEWRAGNEYEARDQVMYLARMLEAIACNYEAALTGGAHQILSKVRQIWEYLETTVGHKAVKAVKKAKTMAQYHDIVRNLI